MNLLCCHIDRVISVSECLGVNKTIFSKCARAVLEMNNHGHLSEECDLYYIHVHRARVSVFLTADFQIVGNIEQFGSFYFSFQLDREFL